MSSSNCFESDIKNAIYKILLFICMTNNVNGEQINSLSDPMAVYNFKNWDKQGRTYEQFQMQWSQASLLVLQQNSTVPLV